MSVYVDDLRVERTFADQRHGRFKGRTLRGVWSNATFGDESELEQAKKVMPRGGTSG